MVTVALAGLAQSTYLIESTDMKYLIQLSAQGSPKPFAYHERPNLMQAHDLANRLRKRHPNLTVTVKESN